MDTPLNESVAIIGAGLAGLACALRLRHYNIPYHIYEASDDVGGRVRTDIVDGFRCDRGFQVLLENYPECKRVLDYESLELRAFEPGAKIRIKNSFHTVADPRRKPQLTFKSMKAPVGTVSDKQKVAFWGKKIASKPLRECFKGKDQSTLEYLRQQGFSSNIINSFFRPFLGGIYLESSLSTSSHMTEFIMKMMASGRVTLPRYGMGAISYQLADMVGRENISLETKIENLNDGKLKIKDGETVSPKAIVIATEGHHAEKLLGLETGNVEWNGTHCFYYSVPRHAFEEPWLHLNGSGKGIINNIAPVSAVSNEYEAHHKGLISVSVLEENAEGLSADEIESKAKNDLNRWFGKRAEKFEPITYYHIKHALPKQPPGFMKHKAKLNLPENTAVCGDFRLNSSIDGALRSGRLAAEKIRKCIT